MSETTQTQSSTESFWKIFLITLFVGFLGVHRFITGKTKSGLIQLFTFGGVGFWTFFDLIQVLRGKFTDKHNLPIKNTSPKASWAVAIIVCLAAIGSHSNEKQSSSGSSHSNNSTLNNSSSPDLDEVGLKIRNFIEGKMGGGGQGNAYISWGFKSGDERPFTARFHPLVSGMDDVNFTGSYNESTGQWKCTMKDN